MYIIHLPFSPICGGGKRSEAGDSEALASRASVATTEVVAICDPPARGKN